MLTTDPVAGENRRLLLDLVSEDIIKSHLGESWYIENIAGAMGERARDYLHWEASPQMQLLSAHRVHELARRLYELQSFSWFERVLTNVHDRDDLSGVGFELDILQVLHFLVSIVTPQVSSGHKGEDYDISLQVTGLRVPIEVKAKDDNTEYSANTIINTVKGAASQLPKGQKGFLFLRIPSFWVGAQLEDEYSDILLEATRQTSRIAAVITAIDKMHLNPEQTAGHVTRHHHFFRHPEAPQVLWDACCVLKELLERDLATRAVDGISLTLFAPIAPF
jgi:hypothetical protein